MGWQKDRQPRTVAQHAACSDHWLTPWTILAVFPAVSAFCASTFPLWPLDGTSKRIGQDWLPAYGAWDAFVCPNSLPSLYVSASLADAAYFKSWLSPRRRPSQFRRRGIHDVFPTPPILFRYSAGPSIAGSSLRVSLTRSKGLDSTSMISPCSSTVCKPTDRSGA